MEKYLKVVQPMNNFKMLTETLHRCLGGRELNSCIEYETGEMWPVLKLKFDRYGCDGSEVPQLDLTTFGEIPVAPEIDEEDWCGFTAE